MYKGGNPAKEITQVEAYSATTKRKKLRLIRRQSSKSANEKTAKETVLDGVLHELQNCLQSIGMGIDLLQLTQPDGLECRTINFSLERASRLLREVQEYFFPPEVFLSAKHVGEVVTEAICVVENELKGANIRLHNLPNLPSFQYDWLVVGRVLERILRCACGIQPSKKGETVVSIAFREETRPILEITIDISGTEELAIEKEKIFTPFWRAHDYQAGLGLMLARQAMQSRNGQLTFEKISSCQAQFSLLLETPFNSIMSSTRKEENHGCMEG